MRLGDVLGCAIASTGAKAADAQPPDACRTQKGHGRLPGGDMDEHKADWERLKSRARSQWLALTERDLEEIGGDRRKLIEKLRARYRLATDEAERQVHDFQVKNVEASPDPNIVPQGTPPPIHTRPQGAGPEAE
jgi:uncharacterized protein YjbJ (UPF0337 family)